MTELVIDGEVVDEQSDGLALTPQASTTLFHTDDPLEVLTRATEVAKALKHVIEAQRLYSTIGGKKHVHVEGWQTLGFMVGVTAINVWTRRLDDGWEARSEVHANDGRMIGAAEAECTKSEGGNWKRASDNAIRSMAQTRATSKALRSVLAFVMTLGGYAPTPAEEVEGREVTEIKRPAPGTKPKAAPVTPTQKAATGRQKGMLNGLATKAGLTASQYADCIKRASNAPIREWADENAAQAWIKRALDRLPDELVDAVKDEIGKAKK